MVRTSLSRGKGAWLEFFKGLLNYWGCYCKLGCTLGCHLCSDISLCSENIETMPLMHSFIHISLKLFFSCILWLPLNALSCHCIQADYSPDAWIIKLLRRRRRRPLKHRHMCECRKLQLGAADTLLYWLRWGTKAKKTRCIPFRNGCSSELQLFHIVSTAAF